MEKKQKIDIIMFNMSTMYDWDHGIVNRNYNILQNLAKQESVNKIVSVDFFPISFRKAIKHYGQNILYQTKNHEMVYGDLTSACYQKTEKIYVYSSIDSIFSWKTVARELRRIEKALNLQNIVFWSYNPMFLDFIGKLKEKLFVFDTVDNWSEHKTYTKFLKKDKFLNNYQKIAQSADVIFTVSEELIDFYQKYNRTDDLHWVANGVDYDHFNDENLLQQETALDQLDKPIIGYLGTIQDRLDYKLIYEVLKNNQDKYLVLAGPVWKQVKHEVDALQDQFKNLILTGRIEWNQAPAVISRFDVAIIPHLINDFIKSTNPMKMYDYLACGKPVVTTPGAGVYMFEEQMYIAETAYDFNKKINVALAEDSTQKQLDRKKAVKSHAWSNRVAQMVEVIQNKLN